MLFLECPYEGPAQSQSEGDEDMGDGDEDGDEDGGEDEDGVSRLSNFRRDKAENEDDRRTEARLDKKTAN